MQGFFVTGTDTDVGKTVVAAWLLAHLDAAGHGPSYWKPVQAGTEPETDSAAAERFSGLSGARILPEAYVLPEPMAPHEAARRVGIALDMAKIAPPAGHGPLVVEGAGGMLVPLTEDRYVIDIAEALDLPVILAARSTLGTINHTLLSLEALRRRKVTIAGVVMNGPPTPHNREAIERYGKAEIVAEIPRLDAVTRDTLLAIKPEIELARLARITP